jgi:hypothetical protein
MKSKVKASKLIKDQSLEEGLGFTLAFSMHDKRNDISN